MWQALFRADPEPLLNHREPAHGSEDNLTARHGEIGACVFQYIISIVSREWIVTRVRLAPVPDISQTPPREIVPAFPEISPYLLGIRLPELM
jgi:hypothetical protein